jgi:hypothetical protein
LGIGYFRSFLVFCCVAAWSTSALAGFEGDDAEKPWAEIEAQLPAYPRDENLLAFFVSAASDNKFMIDTESISLGSDGVVRYTLVITSASGAKNVSYEGLRCLLAERRLYAFGRADKTWSKARSQQWGKLKSPDMNRQHAVLYFEYFCPNGLTVRDAEEARQALRAGSSSSSGMR